MAEQGGIYKIKGLRRRWIIYQVLEDVLYALYAALYVGALVYYLLSPSLLWGIFTFPVVLFVLLAVNRPWQMSDEKIAAFLNREYPELQESSQLLLLPAEELNTLQVIASNKTAAVLAGLKVSHKPFARRLMFAFVSLIVATGLIWGLGRIFHVERMLYGPDRPVAVCAPTSIPDEVILPQISSVEVTITPPAYTHKGKSMQEKFGLYAEEGATVNWNIKTNISVKKVVLIFDDKEKIALKASDKNTGWYAAKLINKPGFYQVSINGKLSELYQIQVVKDSPPVIHVKSPKQYTYIDAGEAPRVTVNATLNDDYGIAGATIMATVAKGRGEGVKFKEYKIGFPFAFGGKPQYDVQRLINLPALNMEPGDELYFYIQAQDTHRQQSRTDVFTVSIQDTAELLSMDGVLSGANLKPEFFRSERQIIIDAERLIKEKDSIDVEKFNNRSNDLGIDQKLLRLRYGKFLGEEGEDAIAAADNTPVDPADFGNGKKILKEYTDDHDNAEDAGFFEPAIKAQLKATLTEMWKAELQLRLYKPRAALPFAYKALRLLKDLQQKSRSFVAKTSYNPPPLKPEKRLSGELDKITDPVNQQDIKPAADQLDALKKAVSVLEALKIKPVLSNADNRTLQVANQQLSLRASAQPGVYLPSLSAMRRVLTMKKVSVTDINIVERALQKTLIPLKTMPASANGPADMGLSRQYYKNLKQNNR